jgi:hypothetical protein
MLPVPTPFDFLQAWTGLLHGSMSAFNQPILPGWTFNIDSNNSSSPRTEADVVSQFSYGKQLGKISDALAWIIARRDDAASSAVLSEFTTMKNEIDLVKLRSAQRRLEQVARDLATLKQEDPREFKRVASVLRNAIADE